ncbi:MAG: hypothetical protein J6A01_09450 [Proteobacteria bacterium]|nr:hypothetical protein [Pseudomonadota bacterium]
MAENEEVKEEKKEMSFGDRLSSFLGSASKTASSLFDSATVKATELSKDVKGAVEEKIRERDANEIYRKLGKKVYTLVQRDELKLPESCDKYIEALGELYAEDDNRDDSGEQAACECKDGECKCDEEHKDA